jgi:hypothetical protein
MPKWPLISTVAVVAGCGAGHPGAQSGQLLRPSARISSSIAEGAQLARPVRWEAQVVGVPSSEVVAVRFLIDGRLRHLEREVPYVFDGSGNMLLPGSIGAGTHTFAVDARLIGRRRLTVAATATIARTARGVPQQVVGRWTRVVKPVEVARTESFRDAAAGDPLPIGTWRLRIGSDGVARYVDPTSSHDLTVGQVRFERDGRLVVGNEVPNFPRASEGGFCPDTVGVGTYRWSLHGGALVVHVIHDRECADRNSFWTGRFTR